MIFLLKENHSIIKFKSKLVGFITAVLFFPTFSTSSLSRKNNEYTPIYYTKEQIDYFGIFCPDNGKCYLIPFGGVSRSQGIIRIVPVKNNQKKKIRMGLEYEI